MYKCDRLVSRRGTQKEWTVCAIRRLQELSFAGVVRDTIVVVHDPNNSILGDSKAFNLLEKKTSFSRMTSATSRTRVLEIVVLGVSVPRSISWMRLTLASGTPDDHTPRQGAFRRRQEEQCRRDRPILRVGTQHRVDSSRRSICLGRSQRDRDVGYPRHSKHAKKQRQPCLRSRPSPQRSPRNQIAP